VAAVSSRDGDGLLADVGRWRDAPPSATPLPGQAKYQKAGGASLSERRTLKDILSSGDKRPVSLDLFCCPLTALSSASLMPLSLYGGTQGRGGLMAIWPAMRSEEAVV